MSIHSISRRCLSVTNHGCYFLCPCYQKALFLSSGLPSHVYFHGALPLLLGGLPAALCALLVSVLLVLPVVGESASVVKAGPFHYLKLRFQSRSLVVLARALALAAWMTFTVRVEI